MSDIKPHIISFIFAFVILHNHNIELLGFSSKTYPTRSKEVCELRIRFGPKFLSQLQVAGLQVSWETPLTSWRRSATSAARFGAGRCFLVATNAQNHLFGVPKMAWPGGS